MSANKAREKACDLLVRTFRVGTFDRDALRPNDPQAAESAIATRSVQNAIPTRSVTMRNPVLGEIEEGQAVWLIGSPPSGRRRCRRRRTLALRDRLRVRCRRKPVERLPIGLTGENLLPLRPGQIPVGD